MKEFMLVVGIASALVLGIIALLSLFAIYIFNKYGEKRHITISLSLLYIILFASIGSLTLTHILAIFNQ